MANELKDVLRVNAAEATLDATIRNKQIGMATDTYRLGANFNATLRHYSADEVAATYTAKRTIQLTTDQLRLGYSAGVYSDIGVAADGDLQVTIGATPAVTFDGSVPGQIRIGATAANAGVRGVYCDLAAQSWTNDYYGNFWGVVKTGGVTDVNDRYFGNTSYLNYNQSGGVLGDTYMARGIFQQILGAVGTSGNDRTVRAGYDFLDLDGGSIVGSAIGQYIGVDQEKVHTITGDVYGAQIVLNPDGAVTGDAYALRTIFDQAAQTGTEKIGGNAYGHYIDVDSDGVVDGSVYGLYINCLSNVDWGLYNTGTSYLGGNVGIGINAPDSTLHVQNGSAGTVTAIAGTIITAETSGDRAYLSLLVGPPDEAGAAGGIVVGDDSGNNYGTLQCYAGIANTYWEMNLNGAQAIRMGATTLNYNAAFDIQVASNDIVTVEAAGLSLASGKILKFGANASGGDMTPSARFAVKDLAGNTYYLLASSTH